MVPYWSTKWWDFFLNYYQNYFCSRCTFFPDFSFQKLEVHMKHKNYVINFFQLHASLYSRQDDQKEIISIVLTNIFYAITEKYSLECVFVYNFLFPNDSLCSPQASYIFVWTCLSVCSKYWANFAFSDSV